MRSCILLCFRAFTIAAVLWFYPAVAVAEFPWKDGDKVLFLGDSITQDGRYVALAEAYLWAAMPNRDIDIINAGLSSETVSGITEPIHPYPRPNVQDRLERALELTEPDWVVVCYGMNDGIYHPAEPRILEAYEKGLKAVVDKIIARRARVILLTPPSFDINVKLARDKQKGEAPDKATDKDVPYGYQNPYLEYDKTLVALGDIVKKLGKQEGVDRVIDVHAATDRYIQRIRHSRPDYLYGDGVHPPLDGHLTMAIGLLRGLDCEPDAARETIARMTGVRAALGESAKPTDAQNAFRDALFNRSAARGAAYRNKIGAATIKEKGDVNLDEANAKAAEAEQKLRSQIPPLMLDSQVFAPYRDAAEKKWRKEIETLLARDASGQYPNDAVLFIGSSSIRLWDSIAEDVSPYTPIQRGYGGAKFSDLAVFADRLISPHTYQALVVFAANDVVGKDDDLTPQQVADLAEYISRLSLSKQPDAPVLIVEITPTPARFAHYHKIRQVNDHLRALALTIPGVHFVATADHYLDADRLPRSEWFKSDKLHQNAAGYQQWGKLITARLDEVLAKELTAAQASR